MVATYKCHREQSAPARKLYFRRRKSTCPCFYCICTSYCRV